MCKFGMHPTQVINRVVESYILAMPNSKSEKKEEAFMQLYRFWDLSIPMLLEYVESKDPDIARLVFTLIAEMRNEQVYKSLSNRALLASKDDKKQRYLPLFEQMKVQNPSLLEKREILEEKMSQLLYEKYLLPVEKELKK